ncbi:small integral membrane protein 1 [Aplochiton taeniatus]
MTSGIDSTPAGVQYNRWNEDNVNLNVEGSQSRGLGVYYKVCTGSMGMVVKVAGALAALVSVYIVGYVTGYYVHRC